MKRYVAAIIATAIFLGGLRPASASPITLDSTVWGRGHAGRWDGGPGFGNTFVGFSVYEYRGAWQFEIPDLTGFTVTSATLRLSFEQAFNTLPETFELSDVSATTIPLLTGSYVGATASTIHTDLGTGSVYGTNAISAGTTYGTLIDTSLSAAALADIAASSNSSFAIGMRSTTIDESGNDGFRWDTSPRQYQLILNTTDAVTGVPEPTSMALLGLASLGGLGVRWRQRRKAKNAETAA